jgi:hypothetical protein
VEVPSVDATCVYPKVLELVLGCLFGAGLQLLKTVLILLISSASNILQENLSIAPSVRKNRIRRNYLAAEVC